MAHGFLGFNATFMLDVVVCALVLVVPLLGWSIYIVRVRKDYVGHRRMQLFLAAILFFAVTAFEIDVQAVHGGWQNIVRHARPEIAETDLAFVHRLLRIHLWFAVSTPVLWGATIGLALACFGNPPQPSSHSPAHKRMGWIAAADLALTSVTGLLFYYFAFVAR
jgi:hypothetical protein